MNRFAHLFCCSCYSFHRGAFTPRQLVHAAKSSGANAVALTDCRGLYGAVPFYRAALEAGVRPIFGASFPVPTPGATLVVLARDAGGYGNLCRLITADQLARPKPGHDAAEKDPKLRASDGPATRRGDLPELALQHPQGLIFLTSDPDFLRRLRPHLARDALYVELFRGESARSRQLMRRLCGLAQELDLRGVATNRVQFLAPEDYEFHRLLRAIGTLKTIETLTADDVASRSCFFASPARMAEDFKDLPDAVAAAADVADMCEVHLPLGRMRMPEFDARGGASPEDVLRGTCRSAIPRFYAPRNRPAAQVRLEHELDVVCSMGYAPYFLAVADVVRFANEKRIPATGRGSAADSLVSYLLGLTHVDPIAHNLYFERFLNRERSSPPDVDIDLCWRRRDDVIDYVYRRWGEDRVAMISTHVTYAGRSCVREVGKAMGLSEGEIGQYTRYLPHLGPADFSNVKKERPESRHLDFEAEPMRSIAPMAKRIEGYPSHLSVHPSGIVVSPEPLTNWVPLERAAKGLVVTQYDMHPIEDLGLLKIDLLGQRSLSVIADVCEQVRKERDPAFTFKTPGMEFAGAGKGAEHEPPDLGHADKPAAVDPEADVATQDLLAEGRTLGVFQVESPSMRGVLRKVRARDFETVTAASSVIRPGPKDSGMLRAWVRRHRGLEPDRFAHPRLREILAETHGVIIYQEDVLKVAQVIAGMTLGRADVMRRSMSDKRPSESFESMEKEFFEGARRNGVAPQAAAEIWRQMRAFAGYAFCKAHSASYTALSFRSAYLKAHFPAEFMAAVLANGGGFYDRAAYASETRRLGLKIRGPSLNASEKRWTGRDDWVRCGLEQIKGLKERSLEAILEERNRHGPYRSLADALDRLPAVDRTGWDLLVLCGACDDFPGARPQCLWMLDRWFALREEKNARVEQIDLFSEPGRESQPSVVHGEAGDRDSRGGLREGGRPATMDLLGEIPDLPEFPFDRLYDEEVRILEVAIRCHPLERFRALLPDPVEAGILPACDLPSRAGGRARLVGWLVTSRRLRTSKGAYMKFLTLEDETDIYEAILFDRAYQQFGHLTVTGGPYIVEGRVEEQEGHCSLHIDRLELLRA